MIYFFTPAHIVAFIVIVIILGTIYVCRMTTYDPCTEPFPERFAMIREEIRQSQNLHQLENCTIRFQQFFAEEIRDPNYKEEIDELLYQIDEKHFILSH